MASFSKGTSFTDGVTGDVTAAKLHALVDSATPVAGLILDRTNETVIGTDDVIMISDTSESGALNKMTVENLFKAPLTGTINSTAGTIQTLTSSTATITGGTFSGSINSTAGTIGTLNSTTGTITTGVIPTLTSTTLITSGTGTFAAPAIVPTGDTNTGIFFPAADTIAFSEGGTEAMRIDSSGNVGIGASSPSFNTGSGLEVLRAGVSTVRLYNTSSTTVGEIRADSVGLTLDGIGATSTLRLSTGGGERLRIDSSGNVGIGGSPSTLLNIIKDDRANGAVLRLTNSAESSSWVSGDIIGDIDFFSSDSSGSGVRGRIRSVSEGGATNPNSVAMSFWTYSGGNVSERLRIDSSGNVGIGTASPSGRLSVSSGSAAQYASFNSNAANGGYLTIESSGTVHGDIGTAAQVVSGGSTSDFGINARGSRNLVLGTNNTERLRIDSSGFVSIGTATGLSALHVHGNVTLSNTTTATSAGTGGLSKPATYAGYLTVSINGTSRKIPYYAT